MATWDDVERVGLTLPESSSGAAHEGSPAILVRAKQFARLRWDDAGHEVLQFWVQDTDLVETYVQEDASTYWGAPGFSRKVVMARLDRVATEILRELLLESWMCRAPASLSRAHSDLR